MNNILSEQMEKALDTIRGICKVSLDCEFCPFYMGDKDEEIVCNCFFISGTRATPDVWDKEVLKDYEVKIEHKGKWLDHYYPHFDVAGICCSTCGKDVEYWERHYDFPKYCPNCGADMREADNEDKT